MKILYLTNIPSPYRVAYFNELGKYCELTVLFETSYSTERDKSWKNYQFDHFTGIIMKGVRTSRDTAFCPFVVKYLKKEIYDCIILTVLSSPTGLLAAAWLRRFQIPYCYEGDGGIAKNTRGLKASLKRFIISYADICFSTTNDFDRYCLTYGALKEKIRRYPFTSIYEKDILPQIVRKDEKCVIKEHLEIEEERIVLSVGRVIPLKGYDVLLKAFGGIKSNWGLYIIGGEVNEELRDIIIKKGIEHVHFVKFKQAEELKQYYMAADIFVLSTRSDTWGLVINEAMSCGLPVITTYSCGAGTEMVRQGENGFLYKAEDVESLGRHMKELMESEEIRRRMGEKSLSIVRNYTIEKMAEVHLAILGND